MKRPIAEVQSVTVQAGAEAEWLRDQQEAWQILRRKSGYVAHHLYQAARDHQQRLVYSEWESKKALDGARQFLGSTPLGRRLRATLGAAPQRLVMELIGPVTSTKGLDLPQTAVAATALAHLPASETVPLEQLAALGKGLASQPGHITHLLLRGFDDPGVIGVLSYWQDAPALDAAIGSAGALEAGGSRHELVHVCYEPLRPQGVDC